MKHPAGYIPLTHDQITEAQHKDIAQYLLARGEKVFRKGNGWRWDKHDSCFISGFKWYQNSTGEHGAAVAFVMHFFDMPFPAAVLELTEGRYSPAADPGIRETDAVKKHIQFRLPDSADNHRRLFAYLNQTRKISADIIAEFLLDKLIYQDTRGNIVFVCYDSAGVPSAAHLRGTNTAVRFRGFVDQGDFSCGFCYECPDADTVHVFEAPIDLMSYITLHRHEPWHRCSYLSLGGLSDAALLRFLHEHSDIRHIVLCTDNDADKPHNPGQSAAHKMQHQLGRKYDVRIETPALKDWNAVLCKEENK